MYNVCRAMLTMFRPRSIVIVHEYDVHNEHASFALPWIPLEEI